MDSELNLLETGLWQKREREVAQEGNQQQKDCWKGKLQCVQKTLSTEIYVYTCVYIYIHKHLRRE